MELCIKFQSFETKQIEFIDIYTIKTRIILKYYNMSINNLDESKYFETFIMCRKLWDKYLIKISSNYRL